jgi:hypothetical protein
MVDYMFALREQADLPLPDSLSPDTLPLPCTGRRAKKND